MGKVSLHQAGACSPISFPSLGAAFEDNLLALRLKIGECLRPRGLAQKCDLLFKRGDRLAKELRRGERASCLFPCFTGFENSDPRRVGRRLQRRHGDFHALDLESGLADLGGFQREIGSKVSGSLESTLSLACFARLTASTSPVRAITADLSRTCSQALAGRLQAVFPPLCRKGVHHPHGITKSRGELVPDLSAHPRRRSSKAVFHAREGHALDAGDGGKPDTVEHRVHPFGEPVERGDRLIGEIFDARDSEIGSAYGCFTDHARQRRPEDPDRVEPADPTSIKDRDSIFADLEDRFKGGDRPIF